MSATRSTVNLSQSCSWLRDTTAAGNLPLAGTIEVPVQIGPVKLVKQVGEGGMGVVWLGRHEVLRRDVAVKFLLSQRALGGDDPEAEMFVQGARAAAAVRHPSLTTVHDAGVVNGVPYVVMEYIDGPTMSDVLRRGPLSLAVVRTVLERVCEAVEELHAHDLVHRDIKPGNIMLTRRGEVLVTDFGLASPRVARGSGPDECVGVSGTPAYMAPEMFDGAITAQTDVYAIGATAFELLTGTPPFQGTLPQLRAAAAKDPVPVERLAARAVSEDVVAVILRCLNKETMFRPRSAGRAWAAFETALAAGRPVVQSAGREEMRRLATAPASEPGASHPGPRAGPRSAKAVSSESQTPVAHTMFGLVSTWAERKRTSAPAEGAGYSEPVPPLAANALPKGSRCRGCGYLLEGISCRRCPECGALVALVVQRPGSERRKPRKGLPAWPRAPLSLAALAAATAIGTGVVAAAVFSDRFQEIELLGLVLGPLIALPMFAKLGYRAWGTESGPVCGWCGSMMPSVDAAACPECGHAPDDRGSHDDPPPSRERGRTLRVAAFTITGLTIAAGLAAFAAVVLANVPSLRSEVPIPYTEYFVRLSRLLLAPLIAAVTVITLLVYHGAVRESALLDGPCRCGNCGARGDHLRGARCLVCEQARADARETTEAAEANERRLWHAPIRMGPLVLSTFVGLTTLPASVLAVYATGSLAPYDYRPYAVVGAMALAGPLALLPATIAYRRTGLRAPGGGAGPRCGWCAYSLRGIDVQRCPECGGQVDGKGDRPRSAPRHAWTKAMAVAVAIAMTWLITFLLVTAASFVYSLWQREEPGTVILCLQLGFAVLFATGIALGRYHYAVRHSIMLNGQAWCGKCGARSPVIAAGRCSHCQPETPPSS